MQLTKGAIGNLINRYTAVLKKCHLMNTFGSLAVAGMLVMGGAGVAGANTIAHIADGAGTHNYPGETLSYSSPDNDAVVVQGGKLRQNIQVNIGNTETKNIDVTAQGGIFVKQNGHVTLTAKNINLTSTAESGGYAALWAQNNSVNTDNIPENERASITINADKTSISSNNLGIVAMSNGIVTVNGDLSVKAKTALLARGDAQIHINTSGTSTVQIVGDVEFSYHEKTSGTGIDATIDVNLNGKDSFWEGNTFISWDTKPNAEKLDVDNFTLSVKDGAVWRPTQFIEADNGEYTPLNTLKLDNGIVDVQKDVAVTIEDISGSGTIANAGTMSLGTTGTGELGGPIDNTGTMNITGAVTLAQGSSYTQSGAGSLTVKENATLANKGAMTINGGSLTVKENATLANKGAMTINGGSLTVKGTASFANDSLLAVNGNALTGDNAAITVMNGGTLEVENKARLRIDNAKNGQTHTIVNNQTGTEQGKWSDGNIEASTDLLTPTMDENGNVTFKRDKDASDVFTGMDSNTAAMLNTLIDKGLNNVDSDQMGVRFLSRATDNRFLGMDKEAAAESIESAARIAFAGAAPQMTRMASDAGTNAVVNRLGFANPADGAQAMDAEGKIVDRNTTGFALWIAPLWQSQHGWGMDADSMDYGFNGNLGGVSLGADYTFENAIRAGITFNIGGGYAESSGGDLSSTENRMNFWGLGAYAGWNYENFGVMADVSYTSTWNQLKQDLDSRLGMGNKLEADVQASAISAGLRAEYLLQTSAMDIIPHIGVRYMSLNTWGYDVDTHGGTVLEGDSLHQDIWTFPIGVTFTKDFALDSGWNFKPSLDFSVIPAAGDIKAKHDVHFTGLPGTYEVETQMMDYLTWQGGVGLELANDNMSIGVNYTLQAGQHTTGHGVFGSFRYEF